MILTVLSLLGGMTFHSKNGSNPINSRRGSIFSVSSALGLGWDSWASSKFTLSSDYLFGASNPKQNPISTSCVHHGCWLGGEHGDDTPRHELFDIHTLTCTCTGWNILWLPLIWLSGLLAVPVVLCSDLCHRYIKALFPQPCQKESITGTAICGFTPTLLRG